MLLMLELARSDLLIFAFILAAEGVGKGEFWFTIFWFYAQPGKRSVRFVLSTLSRCRRFDAKTRRGKASGEWEKNLVYC